MSTVKTAFQWVVDNDKRDFKVGKIFGGVGNYTPSTSYSSEDFKPLLNISSPSVGDKIFSRNMGADGSTTVFGYNSLDIGTPFINACEKTINVGISDDKIAFSIVKEDYNDTSKWLKMTVNGNVYHLDTGVEPNFYYQGFVTYIMLVTDDTFSKVRLLTFINHMIDTSQSAGSGSYALTSGYVFGDFLPSDAYNNLKTICFDSDREKQYTVNTSTNEYIYSKFGRFAIQKMGNGHKIINGVNYDYTNSYGWDGVTSENSFPVEDDTSNVIRGYEWGGVEEQTRTEQFEEYAYKFYNYTFSSGGWTLGTNLICGIDSNKKFTQGLATLDNVQLGTFTYDLNGGKIVYNGNVGGSSLNFYVGSSVVQTINLYNIEKVMDTIGRRYTYGAFICKINDTYKLCIVGNTSANVRAFTIELNSDLQDLLRNNVVEEVIEYNTPTQDCLDNTGKERRGEDEQGSYTETYDPVTKTWTKTYDYDRSYTGDRGKGDGTSTPGKDDTRIEEPKAETTLKVTGAMYSLFVPTISELRSFASDLHDSSVLNQIKEYFSSNPMDGIMGLSMIPYFKTADGSGYPTIGSWTSSNPMSVTSDDVITFNYGTSAITKECFGNFLDYSATKISIFLPHIGYKELDPQLVMGCSITLKYNIFRATGDILAYLYADNHLLYQWQGNCALQIPVTHLDYSTCVSATINALSRTASTVSGMNSQKDVSVSNGADILASSMNSIANANKPNLMTSGSISGASGFYSSRQAYITLSQPTLPMEDDKQYRHDFGKPSCEVGQIRTLKGFTLFSDIDISNISCLDAEKDELKSKLTSEGIYV